MGDQDRPESAFNLAGDEQHEERDADENVRHDERRVDKRMVDGLETVLPTVKRQRRSRANHAGDHRRESGNRQREPETVQQRLHRIAPREDLLVPSATEADEVPLGVEEAHGNPVRNEAVDDDQDDGNVEKGEDTPEHRHGKHRPLHRAPPSDITKRAVCASSRFRPFAS